MEKRKETLRTKRVCRFCLKDDEPLTSIYDRSIRGKNPVPLALQIMACVAIEVFPSDGMPGTICQVCRYFMDQSYRFKQICKQGDEALRHYLSHGDLRPPIAWPKDMIQTVPETVLGGNIPQVSASRDGYSEDDEEEEEVVEKTPKTVIKIEPAEAPALKRGRPRKHPKVTAEPKAPTQSTTTVVVTAQETEDGTTYDIEEEDEEEEDSNAYEDGELENPPAEVPTNNFPCNECERSFRLKQLLEIHQQNHKRERTHPCNVCNRSFFSKYDLQKHETVHSGLKPYECVVCHRPFARLTLLRRHEKVHTTVPKLLCTECDMVFLSVKELDSHQKKRHSVEKPFRCTRCPKKFAFKQGLERHSISHSNQRPYKCDYCPESFTSSIRLTKHVQSHAGNRPYLCKFCPKTFLLSHHYTRHLRTKHMPESEASKKRQSLAASEHYKCARCNVIFQKQDEMIFHSAIHATQDLTCPLCKEIFQDVDDVVVHIKSHIEGEQFMCEWCDLVFMCEEKLDVHIDTDHREAATEDPFKEISYLEGRLVDESELLSMDQSLEGEARQQEDEEDEEFYENQQENTQNAEEEEDEEFVQEEEEEEESKTKDVVLKFADEPSVNTSILAVEIPLITNDPQPVNSPILQPDDESKPTYIELQTVQPPHVLQKKLPEIVQKKTISSINTKASILQKAEQVKMQRKLDEELKEKHRASLKASEPLVKSSQVAEVTAMVSAKIIEEVEEKRFEKVDSSKVQKLPAAAVDWVDNEVSVKTVSQKVTKMKLKEQNQKATNSSEISEKTQINRTVVGGLAKGTDAQKSPEKEPQSPRSGEKSLQMLERDIMELKKGAKSGNDRQQSGNHQRFLSRKSLPVGKRDRHSVSPEARNRKSYIFKTPQSVKKLPPREPTKAKAAGDERSLTKPTKIVSSSVFPIPVKPLAPQPSTSVNKPSMTKSSVTKTPIAKPAAVTTEDESDGDESPPRRSRRPSKIKDYAAMIRDRTGLDSDDEDVDDDEDDEELYDAENEEFDVQHHSTPVVERKPAAPTSTGKKRGRPRKNPLPESPATVSSATTSIAAKALKRAADVDERPGTSQDSDQPVVKRGRGRPRLVKNLPEEEVTSKDKPSTPNSKSTIQQYFQPTKQSVKHETPVKPEVPKAPIKVQKIEGVVQSVTNLGQTVLMSPSGQTLKKIPAQMIKSLPPGVKPVQLPRGAQFTEMKMGPRTVRVKKILMTKAEVEDMTKKGLVEFKDGAMVLKPGVKLPTSVSRSSPVAQSSPTTGSPVQSPTPVQDTAELAGAAEVTPAQEMETSDNASQASSEEMEESKEDE